MAIFKAEVSVNFTQIPNATIQDQALSFEATGLLSFLLSLPANWEIHKEWVQKQKKGCGRDKLTKLFKELQDAGYMRKVAKREGARLKGWDWFIYPEPNAEILKTRSTGGDMPENTEQRNFSATEIQCDSKPAAINKQSNKYTESKDSFVSDKPQTKPKSKKSFKFEQRDMDLTIWMFDSIKGKFPATRKPNLDSWANTIRLCREVETKAHFEAYGMDYNLESALQFMAKLFTWANNHHFWSANIRSADKFRKQFEELNIRKEQEKQGNDNSINGSNGNQVSASDELTDLERQYQELYGVKPNDDFEHQQHECIDAEWSEC